LPSSLRLLTGFGMAPPTCLPWLSALPGSHEAERVCHRHRLSRDWWRDSDCRSHCAFYSKGLWGRGMAILMVLSWRGILFISILTYIFIRSQPEEKGSCSYRSFEGGLKDSKFQRGEGEITCSEPCLPCQGSLVPRVCLSHVWFSYIIYMTFFAAYLIKEMGLSQIQAGAIWALWGTEHFLRGALGRHLRPPWKKIWRRPRLPHPGCGLYQFLPWSNAIGFLPLCIVFGLTAWSSSTIIAAAAGDYVGSSWRLPESGFRYPLLRNRQALGPGRGGYLADLTRSFLASFLLASGVSLAGAILSFILKKPPTAN